MLETVRQKELERVRTMTIIEAVAYTNQLASRLKRNDCTDKERRNGLVLLEQLAERVRFLKITPEPAFFRAGQSH